MSRKLCLASLLILAGALFLPWSSLDEVTSGVFVGTVKTPMLATLLVPTAIAAGLGAWPRFGRVRGVVMTILALIGIVLFAKLTLDIGGGQTSPALGLWLALAGSAIAFCAGVLGVVRPSKLAYVRPEPGTMQPTTARTH